MAATLLWLVIGSNPLAAQLPTASRGPTGKEYIDMDYGPSLSATLEVARGNIANKGIAIRLDPGPGGVSQGREFMLFETDTLRYAAGWTGPEFIDWKNIAFNGQHEVHASIRGNVAFSNPDAPGWASSDGGFEDRRLVGRDGNRYGPMPREWGRWKGLYVHGDRVVLSYTIGGTPVLESPGAEGPDSNRALTRILNIGPRPKDLILQVARGIPGQTKFLANLERSPAAPEGIALIRSASGTPEAGPTTNASPRDRTTAVAVLGGSRGLKWLTTPEGDLRLRIASGVEPVRLKLLFCNVADETATQPFVDLLRGSDAPVDLMPLTRGGPAQWKDTITTRMELIGGSLGPYVVESIALPTTNPYRSWMRVGGFDFFKDGRRAAVCTWQGDVWIVDGLGGSSDSFTWKRIACGMFQPLGLKIVDEKIYVTCRDQITVLRDLNGDGETDFYESFNHDAQVTEHFHEFAMDLQTDSEGNFYYAKAARHAKDALVPQHGTLIKVSIDGSTSEIVASGFRAPNGVCVNDDGTFVLSDQEGHWTPQNRINWIKPGAFYGNMMGYHEGRKPDDFEPPVLWIHKTFDRSPAEQLWVTSDRWGPLKGALLSLSYGTGRIFNVLHERVGGRLQGGLVELPITETPTGIMRGRFHPGDGQLYVGGLFGWSSNKTRHGGFYRIRYTGKSVHAPVALHATRECLVITFTGALDPKSAGDADNYAVSRWTYQRTASYGSQDFKISQKGVAGRDPVEVTSVTVSADRKSVLLRIPDMQPSMQMQIKYAINTADGTEISQVIENTIHVLGGDRPFLR
ncbi:MAG: cytochrome C oxidase Cbb3 [Verrucomicrobia bacterium]|nr:cytochrome C oxidase Cbb3 [Verrucomicrobiota bacterium]